MSNIKLVKIGALGGFATVTMGLILKNKVTYNITQTEYYQDALKTLKQHNGAIYLLGEPITERQLDVTNAENFTKGNFAQYKVPLVGSKRRGNLYFWAEKNSELDKWNVIRMELELNNDSSRRLLIKSTSDKNEKTETKKE
ncbi:unnamed protein product [Phyllotreta striolata]|uniref:Uncharacterized protein n=1 Tax=Phyllotreta striolata TaxID=444603 RepID=A0A9N9TXB9_PHYSR|nr:unnamed protein product [Phyllotreta striolata]